ncbi:MAG: sporulation transcriptional regulator SpoIIID [Clostridia bacterium]|nr:sporulation transcriptional regulator SpoIIID [Clostridia bacterium]
MTNYSNEELILEMANYILENHTTIRATAKVFNTPKSTVHHNLSCKLKYINYQLYKKVKKLLEENFQIKHIHGGASTKYKYQKLKQEININDEIEILNS